MTYTKKEIGRELKNQLNRRYDIERISNWAYDLFISFRGDPSPDIDIILDRISLMAAGPEFEYTEKELKLLAEMLINEEKDPIKKIDNMKGYSLENIQIGVTGKILGGMHKDHYIRIEQDFENTERFLILISRNADFGSTDVQDHWIEKYDSLIELFKKSEWKIQWERMMDRHDRSDVTKQIFLFRDFLISAWPTLDLLMENHDWDNDGKFIGEWLQINWEFLVERELLGLKEGSLTPFSITPLAKRISPKPGPIYAVIIDNGIFQKESSEHFRDLPFHENLRLFSLSSRLLNGQGLYPPFDYANLVLDSTGEIFVVPIENLKFQLKLHIWRDPKPDEIP